MAFFLNCNIKTLNILIIINRIFVKVYNIMGFVNQTHFDFIYSITVTYIKNCNSSFEKLYLSNAQDNWNIFLHMIMAYVFVFIQQKNEIKCKKAKKNTWNKFSDKLRSLYLFYYYYHFTKT